jgi:hypothetical protein
MDSNSGRIITLSPGYRTQSNLLTVAEFFHVNTRVSLGHEGVSLRITLGTVLSSINIVCGIHVVINFLVFAACPWIIYH